MRSLHFVKELPGNRPPWQVRGLGLKSQMRRLRPWLLVLSAVLALTVGGTWLWKNYGDPKTRALVAERAKITGRLEDMPGLTDEQRRNLSCYWGGRYFLGEKLCPGKD
jgi:hypothetical protein